MDPSLGLFYENVDRIAREGGALSTMQRKVGHSFQGLIDDLKNRELPIGKFKTNIEECMIERKRHLSGFNPLFEFFSYVRDLARAAG